MRIWMAAVAFTLGTTAAMAQIGVPFGAYEPTPAYLGPSHNDLGNCSASPPPYPYNRNEQRGQPSTSQAKPPPDCPGR